MLDHSPIALAKNCSLRIERNLDTVTIWLAGEFDAGCKDRFQEELRSVLDSLVGRLILDLRGLRFIDSTGLGLLVQIDAAARDDGLDFVVFCGNGAVRRVLSETGLTAYCRSWTPLARCPLRNLRSNGQLSASCALAGPALRRAVTPAAAPAYRFAGSRGLTNR